MEISLPGYIEHTNLRPDITATMVEKLVEEAIAHSFAGVCLPPYWVKKAHRDIGKHPLQLVTVIGFPLGYQRSEVKLKEAEIALSDGATELDVVMNISAFKTGVSNWVKGELAQLASLCHAHEALLKVILETALLSDEEIVLACKIAQDAGTDFVKTSTGFASGGATEAHIRLMRDTVGLQTGVKASGGIRTSEQALAMIAAGADRIGTSSAAGWTWA
jgi:deoxyribose-phosphate aldolase